jgi:peptide chain release factor subunit 1
MSCYGVVVFNRTSALYATLFDDGPVIHSTVPVNIPQKRNHGGRCATRFTRLRIENEFNQLKKIVEGAVVFVNTDIGHANVKGIIIATTENFLKKIDTFLQDHLDNRLRNIPLHMVKTDYSGQQGLTTAIEASEDLLQDISFVREKKVLAKLLDGIAINSDKITYGVENTMFALQVGAVHKLFVAKELDIYRVQIDGTEVGPTVGYITEDKIKALPDSAETIHLLDYIRDKCAGTDIDMLNCSSNEGRQFVIGLGGIACTLRKSVNFDSVPEATETWMHWLSGIFGMNNEMDAWLTL